MFRAWSSVGNDSLSTWGGRERMIGGEGPGLGMGNSVDWNTDEAYKRERGRSQNWRKISF